MTTPPPPERGPRPDGARAGPALEAALAGRFASLQARMVLILGLVLVLPGAYAVVQAVRAYDAQAERQIGGLARLAALVSAHQKESLEAVRQRLQRLAALPAVLAPEPAACAAALAREPAGRLAWLAVADGEGRVTCAAPPGADGPLGQDRASSAWFREIRAGAGFALGPDPAGAAGAVVLAIPLVRAGGETSALAAALPVARLAEPPPGLDPPAGAVGWIVGRGGALLAPLGLARGRPGDGAAAGPPPPATVRQLLAAPEATAVAAGPGGPLRFVAAPVHPGRLWALVGLPAPRWSWLERELVLGILLPALMLAVAVAGIWIATDLLVNRHVRALAAAARAHALDPRRAWPALAGAPLELRELSGTLGRLTAELGAREAELEAALARQGALVRELHHRVKNNLQVVTSLLSLRAQAAAEPAARRALLDAHLRVKALALAHRGLWRPDGEAAGPGPPTVELAGFLGELADLVAERAGPAAGGVALEVELAPARVGIDQAAAVALLLAEALANAFAHAFPAGGGRAGGPEPSDGVRGTVRVRLTAAAGAARLEVADDGVGLAAAGGPGGGRGLGLTLIGMLARQAGGRVTVASGPAAGAPAGRRGTRVVLELPTAPAAGARG